MSDFMKVVFKRILADVYRRIKLPFSILKTNLMLFKPISFMETDHKSASDNGEYPELALKAALDPATYSVFRRHYKYTDILEHVTRKQGEEYLEVIRDKYKLKDDEIFEIIKPLMKVGNPRLLKLRDYPKKYQRQE